jgi:uncharacterized protein (DUF3820 family)
MQEVFPDNKQLLQLFDFKMPFGKYKNWVIMDLPEHYLVWFRQKGFPQGKLGELMGLAYEIRLNGLEDMVNKLRPKRRV